MAVAVWASQAWAPATEDGRVPRSPGDARLEGGQGRAVDEGGGVGGHRVDGAAVGVEDQASPEGGQGVVQLPDGADGGGDAGVGEGRR